MTYSKRRIFEPRRQHLWLGALVGLLLFLTACGNAPAVEAVEPQPTAPEPAVAATPEQGAAAVDETVAEPAEVEPQVIEPEAPAEEAAAIEPMAEEEAAAEAVRPTEPTSEVLPENTTEAPAEQAEAPAPQRNRPLDQFIPTDPATVSLAAGQVQLVEFFAFW